MYNPLTTPIVYIPRHSKSLQLSNRLWRKEFIPIGEFVKDSNGERIPFEVDEGTLLHWKNTFDQMKYNGIEVPMPLNHTENPELRRGTLIDLEIDNNDRGSKSLYGTFKFRDEEAEKALKDADVSIYVPSKFVDGEDNTYIYPIRHVAFTDYPVIPKLGKMQPIAASYVEAARPKSVNSKEKKKMPFPPNAKKEKDEEIEDVEKDDENAEETVESLHAELREIATKLGLDESIPDDKLCAAINHIVDAIMESDGEESDDEPESKGGAVKGQHVAREVKHEEREFHPPIAAGFINIARKSRLQELDSRVEHGILTPAARNKLVKEYCNDDALQLAFSPEGEVFDNFDQVLSIIDDNANAISLNQERSQSQELSLAYNSLKPENNVLLRDAESRAKKVGQ